DEYYLVKSGDTCSAILLEYSITIAQFYTWNPSVGSSCNYMDLDEYYCVGISATSATSTSIGIGPTQTGIASNYVTYYKTQSGDSCWEIVTDKYPYLNETLFIEWNPAVGSSYSILSGYYYLESGDSYWSIETAYDISAANFVSWNPNIESDCSGLWVDYFVYVGV
ncbi:uncharacterized protein N7503_002976, partial [Penicillium pulvis]|uniref:uncharacterized protein n=1 Tax=Penicillium pulvis TaxID=1562058 RepID=UPI0025489024